MRSNQTSLTAMGIAVLRAVESEKPESERICYDPYARRFLPGMFYGVMRFFIRSGYAEWRGKGVIGFLTARERFIDDYLEDSMRQGLDQVVILGAGYDSRAYRFPALRSPMRIFEVDHPATQRDKCEKVRKIFGAIPPQAIFVPIDFNRQSLADCLAAHGYDPQSKSLFIWQGVTYYLDAAAVDQTLAFIAQQSAPGSRLIFDYIDSAVLEKSTQHAEVSSMRRYRGMSGEELRFGLAPGQIEDFLTRRGFEQVHNTRSEDLKALYFHGKNETRRVMSGYAIVSAVVGDLKIASQFSKNSQPS